MWRLRYLFDINNTGLYKDDGAILVRKANPRNMNRSREELINFFKDHKLKISRTTNAKVVNFLDVALDLNTGDYKPHIKDLHRQKYVNSESIIPLLYFTQISTI